MAGFTDQPGWLDETLARIRGGSVAIFGDFCLDAYWLIDPDETELSVETGLPVRRVREQRYSLGGASNVAANVAALGVGNVRAVGLVGNDLFGGKLRALLAAHGVNDDGLLNLQPDWQTMVFAKPHRGDAERNRIDFGGFNTVDEATADALAEALARAARLSDVVILNQQVPKGVSPPPMIEKLNAVVADHPACTFIVDSRHRCELYRGAILKCNAHEAARVCGEPRPLTERIPHEQARRLAAALAARFGRAVFVTRGASGLVIAEGGTLHDVPGIQVLERTDPVGAGDTTVAAIAAVLAGGGDAVTSGVFANIAASITVRKLQTTGTASPEELRAAGPSPEYVYLPELADDPRGARYVGGTEIELVREPPRLAGIRHAVFDHDGTLSTLREGWEGIMEPMMVRAILGPRFEKADEVLYHKVVDTVAAYVERTTGAQTLVQMQGLVGLVRQFGCVPESDILDMHGYKARYNEELLAMVRRRTDKLRRGELEPRDFEIKNARRFLEALRAAGIRLYLASGTDEDDVVAEARAMGYAELFEGRIFGARGDVTVEAKRVVLERLIGSEGLGGSALVTFGDGPVELRETRKRRGRAVGVASDERRRFGLNPAKRRRLIRAGADLIVPDYSQCDALLRVLGVAHAH